MIFVQCKQDFGPVADQFCRTHLSRHRWSLPQRIECIDRSWGDLGPSNACLATDIWPRWTRTGDAMDQASLNARNNHNNFHRIIGSGSFQNSSNATRRTRRKTPLKNRGTFCIRQPRCSNAPQNCMTSSDLFPTGKFELLGDEGISSSASSALFGRSNGLRHQCVRHIFGRHLDRILCCLDLDHLITTQRQPSACALVRVVDNVDDKHRHHGLCRSRTFPGSELRFATNGCGWLHPQPTNGVDGWLSGVWGMVARHQVCHPNHTKSSRTPLPPMKSSRRQTRLDSGRFGDGHLPFPSTVVHNLSTSADMSTATTGNCVRSNSARSVANRCSPSTTSALNNSVWLQNQLSGGSLFLARSRKLSCATLSCGNRSTACWRAFFNASRRLELCRRRFRRGVATGFLSSASAAPGVLRSSWPLPTWDAARGQLAPTPPTLETNSILCVPTRRLTKTQYENCQERRRNLNKNGLSQNGFTLAAAFRDANEPYSVVTSKHRPLPSFVVQLTCMPVLDSDCSSLTSIEIVQLSNPSEQEQCLCFPSSNNHQRLQRRCDVLLVVWHFLKIMNFNLTLRDLLQIWFTLRFSQIFSSPNCTLQEILCARSYTISIHQLSTWIMKNIVVIFHFNIIFRLEASICQQKRSGTNSKSQDSFTRKLVVSFLEFFLSLNCFSYNGVSRVVHHNDTVVKSNQPPVGTQPNNSHFWDV